MVEIIKSFLLDDLTIVREIKPKDPDIGILAGIFSFAAILSTYLIIAIIDLQNPTSNMIFLIVVILEVLLILGFLIYNIFQFVLLMIYDGESFLCIQPNREPRIIHNISEFALLEYLDDSNIKRYVPKVGINGELISFPTIITRGDQTKKLVYYSKLLDIPLHAYRESYENGRTLIKTDNEYLKRAIEKSESMRITSKRVTSDLEFYRTSHSTDYKVLMTFVMFSDLGLLIISIWHSMRKTGSLLSYSVSGGTDTLVIQVILGFILVLTVSSGLFSYFIKDKESMICYNHQDEVIQVEGIRKSFKFDTWNKSDRIQHRILR